MARTWPRNVMRFKRAEVSHRAGARPREPDKEDAIVFALASALPMKRRRAARVNMSNTITCPSPTTTMFSALREEIRIELLRGACSLLLGNFSERGKMRAVIHAHARALRVRPRSSGGGARGPCLVARTSFPVGGRGKSIQRPRRMTTSSIHVGPGAVPR